MRVIVDEDRCVGAGQCVLVAMDVFDQRPDDGIVVLLEQHPSEDQHEAVRLAARVCPAAAITLEEQ